jgi:hypothetical protein
MGKPYRDGAAWRARGEGPFSRRHMARPIRREGRALPGIEFGAGGRAALAWSRAWRASRRAELAELPARWCACRPRDRRRAGRAALAWSRAWRASRRAELAELPAKWCACRPQDRRRWSSCPRLVAGLARIAPRRAGGAAGQMVRLPGRNLGNRSASGHGRRATPGATAKRAPAGLPFAPGQPGHRDRHRQTLGFLRVSAVPVGRAALSRQGATGTGPPVPSRPPVPVSRSPVSSGTGNPGQPKGPDFLIFWLK